MAQTKVKLIADGVIVQGNLHASHGITTAHIGEGSNLYYTDARSRAAISVSGNALSYNSSTGVITSNFEESPTFTGIITASSSSSGDYVRLYGSSGTGKWDIYGNGANLRISDNESAGILAVDTGATFGGNVGIGTTSPNSYSNQTTLTINGTTYGRLDLESGGTLRSSLFSQAANTTLSVSTGFFTIDVGSERLRIDTSGNVLIGSTSFNTGAFSGTAKGLNVSSVTPIVLLHESDTDKDGFIGIAGSTMFVHTADAIPMRFGTSDVERMRITDAGNVGIGTNSPAKKLDIRTDNGVLIKGASGTTNAHLSFLPASGGREYAFSNDGSSFYIKDISADVTRMYFHYNGNLGIGTTSPTANLHVQNASTATLKVITTGVADASVNIQGYDAGVHIGDVTNGLRWAIWNDGPSTSSSLKFGSYALGTWYNDASQVVTMKSDGKVGIGTTSPSYKLHTTGTLLLDTYNAYAIRATNASGTYAPVFATSGNHTYYYNTNASGYLYWRNAADNGTIFAISNSGQIGIGNTAPSYPLHVSLADGNFIAAQNQTNNIASTNVWGYGLYEGGSKLGEISLVRDGSSAQMYIGTTGANQQLRIGVGNKSEAIRIDANRIVYIMGATPSTNNSLQMQYNSTAGSAEIYAKSTGGNTHFEFYTSNSGSTTEKMRINHLGNVGIGTTSPARHLDIREQEQTYSGVLKLSSAWTGSNVWVERLFAASFIRQTQEVGVDLLSLGSIGGNSHVLIEVSILAVAATAQQSAKITFFAGARQTSGGSYGSHYVTNPVVTAIQGSNISAGTPAWQSNTLIYTTYSQSNYTRYQVDFRVTCHDYMNITFEL